MSEGLPVVGAEFQIAPGVTFETLTAIGDAMDQTRAVVVADAAKIERATYGMVRLDEARGELARFGSAVSGLKSSTMVLGGVTAEFASFGNAASRALKDAQKEARLVERAGEGFLRTLSRQNAAFGLTREGLRSLKAEEHALAAERVKNFDLARRLRETESELWGKEARAAQEAAAAQSDLAARAQRLMASIDPAAAAQDRFNKEMGEARLLISEGVITLDQYAAKLMQQQGVMDEASAAMARGGVSAGAHRMAMMGASYQVQDFITQVSMGANPINAFAVQGAQLAGQFANIEGKAGTLARFFMGPWGLAITGGIMLVGMLTKDLWKQSEASENAKNKSLDLTQAIDFQSMSTQQLIASIDELDAAQRRQMRSARQMEQHIYNLGQEAIFTTNRNLRLAQSYYEVMKAQQDAPSSFEGDMAAATAYGVTRTLPVIEAEIKRLGEALSEAERLGRHTEIPLINRRVQEAIDAATAATGRYERAVDSLTDRFKAGQISESIFEQQLLKLANDNKAAQAVIAEAERAKGGGGNRAEIRRIETLQREADATQAQIKNIYGLVDAYGVSNAAVLIAEARVKAESAAIKKRGDISEMVERQIQLAIAERVSESAKGNAAQREQLAVQQAVNAMVAQGIVPAERAADLIQQQTAELPLLAALQVAQQRGYTDAIEHATKALEEQRAVQAKIAEAATVSAFNTAMGAGSARLAELREEGRLIGLNENQRTIAMAKFKAEQESLDKGPGWDTDAYVNQQVKIAEKQIELIQQQSALNRELGFTAELLGAIDENARFAAQGMSEAFGRAGASLGGLLTITTGYHAANQRLLDEKKAYIEAAGHDERAIADANRLFALRSTSLQVGAYGDMASAAKGFFKEGTAGYKAMAVSEKAFRAVEFALSVRAMAQDAMETAQKLATGGARIAVGATEAVVNAIKSLPFPLNIAAGVATVGALASIGVAVGGAFGGSGKNRITPANEGMGTVFGDADAKSESIKRSIDALRDVDTLTANYSRDMLQSLRSIDNQIGGFASLVLRTGGVNADFGVNEGFKANLMGSVLGAIPLVGGLLGSLFGTKTTVTGSGLFAGPQTLEDIMGTGFDASYYSDVKKTKKFLGVSTGSKYSTQYTAADAALEGQFTLILRSFNDAILSAAGPLGENTDAIQRKLNGFIVDIGKIDTRDLTGTELQERLSAVFGAAADRMASSALPGMERFQKAGEGLFETLVRVSSTVETVTGQFTLLGRAPGIGIDAQMALVDQFDSLGDLTSATQSYFETFYSREEQAQAKLRQFTSVFAHMGITLPTTLANFRALVEAQDLTTAAGREVYATLLQVAPAFADLQAAMNGARSAADILSERQDLQRKLLEVQGDTEALRALDLAKLDVSNHALQKQIWAIQDAQEAAKAAGELRKAWTGVSDSILDEVKRIRGLTGAAQGNNFAMLMGQFNAASTSARGGDLDAAKLLPGLSQSLLSAAELAATSRQELDRVRAQVAANLEATHGATLGFGTQPKTTEQLMEALATTVAATAQPANESLLAEFQSLKNDLRSMLDQLRAENNAGHAATAAHTGAMKRKLDDVTAQAGGTAISTVAA